MQDLENRLKNLGDRVSEEAPFELRPTRGALQRIRLGRAVRSGAAIITVGVLVFAGFAASQSLSGSAQPIRPANPSTNELPSPSPGFSRFESTIHEIAIDYPADWQTRPASEAWNYDAVTFGASDVDVIFDPELEGDLYFAIVSEPLNGQAWDTWCCGPLIERTGICARASGFGGGSTTFAGNPAWVQSCGYGEGKPDAGDHVAFVATPTRGYIIHLHVGNARLLETYDEGWFEAALRTLDLRSE